jgi:hypothetical protein
MKEIAPLAHGAEMWNDGLRAKYYGQGKPYGKKEFDKLLGNFGVRLPFKIVLTHTIHRKTLKLTNSIIQAITDVPCIMFVDELVAAYPNAKVVLTNRDPDKWLVSILSTIYVITSWDWERWAIPYIVVCYFFPYYLPNNAYRISRKETHRSNHRRELHWLHAHDKQHNDQ